MSHRRKEEHGRNLKGRGFGKTEIILIKGLCWTHIGRKYRRKKKNKKKMITKERGYMPCFRPGFWTACKRTNGKKQSQSQSHITTDGLSIGPSWSRAPSGAHDQIFVLVWKLTFCLYGAPSLTRGRVCRLSESVSSIRSFVSIYIIHDIYKLIR
jgi:hypothetical protein